ncbi:tubulin-tyrosine ligase [Angomonas deanei]|uniref:Tubulin--tyrosine ligase-like protein 5 n=1 Tax=Angomonas deanei TaxID=59799 RepID=A0A7G2C8R3_9TRYP|nr:tubulin-tyrosine ligase [Angomonas deanei]CAD2215237.1 Tubulin-tyrosine ligase family, putative [Angomonas deanei]|eukprot:EPY22028.1 tubulin-tyrosine ligase [Angomonas deanei]
MSFIHPKESLAPYLVLPTPISVEEEASPFVKHTLTLIQSPFPRRRATLYVEPCDRVVDSEWKRIQASLTDEKREKVTYDRYYVFPTPIPGSTSVVEGLPTKEVSLQTEKEPSAGSAKKKGAGPYHNMLLLFDETATLFTAYYCSLMRNAFLYKSARQNLTETQFCIKYAKRPLRSDFVQVNVSRFQKINQIPSSGYITRKDHLHRSLCARGGWDGRGVPPLTDYEQRYNGGVRLIPHGWVVPEELEECQAFLRQKENKGKLFIVKKVGGTGGLDIALLRAGGEVSVEACCEGINQRSCETAKKKEEEAAPSPTAGSSKKGVPGRFEHSSIKNSNLFMVQAYIDRPYLINGHKFDLRVYVVITSYYPLRLYVYREGLVRIATAPYLDANADQATVAPIDALTAHLTNFTLNKETDEFSCDQKKEEDEQDTFSSYKWPFAAFQQYLEIDAQQHALPTFDTLLQRIQSMLVEVFLSIAPRVRVELQEIHQAQLTKQTMPEGTAGTVQLNGKSIHLSGPPPCTSRGVSPYYQLFGVDVMLQYTADQTDLYPVLIEINGMPSLSSHYSGVDQCVKANLVADTLTLVGLTSPLIRPSTEETVVEGEVPYADFLRSLAYPPAVEACMTLEEEERRSPNFVRAFPTEDGWERHGGQTNGTVIEDNENSTLTGMDYILCEFVKYKQKA